MERTYTIPLRKAYLKTPKYVRTNRAVREVRMYLQHHMKMKDIRLGEALNNTLWARGNKFPPSRVTVLVKKEDDVAYAELAGTDFKKKDFGEKEESEKKEKPAKEAKTNTPKEELKSKAEADAKLKVEKKASK